MAIWQAFLESPFVQVISPAGFILFSMMIAIPPLVVHVLLHPFRYIFTTTPLATRAKALRSKLFWFIWRFMSPRSDKTNGALKAPLFAKAKGVVLEIGAGVGDGIKYYNRKNVEKLILVEPNASMHPSLREKANQSGLFEQNGDLVLLGCGGAQSDEPALDQAGVKGDSVDSIVLVQVLCGIPEPSQAIEMYRRLLKPGGLLIFYEHVRSADAWVSSWQSWYTRVIWPYAFDGCCLNRPTGSWIMAGPGADSAQDLELVGSKDSGANHDNEVVHKRWSDFEINAPAQQIHYTVLPYVVGWAVKA